MIAACIAVGALSALLAWREYLHTQERKDHMEERAQLLDRIQAPEFALQQRAIETSPPELEPLEPDLGAFDFTPPEPAEEGLTYG